MQLFSCRLKKGLWFMSWLITHVCSQVV